MSARAIVLCAVLAGATGCNERRFCTGPDDCGGAACDNGVCQPVPVTTYRPVVEAIQPTSGKAGDTVLLTGAHFGPTVEANQVTFGAAQAVVTSASDTALEVTAPAALAGPVAVSVTVAGETADEQPVFTYQDTTPPPVVAGIDPAAGPEGQPVTIHGSGFGTSQGETVVKFGDEEATVSSVSPGEVQVLAPSGTGTVPVSVTVAGRTAANEPSFRYFTSPCITMNVAFDSTSIPIGGSTMFTVTLHNGCDARTGLVIQALVVQGSTTRGAGGSNLDCPWVPDGTLPVGDCAMSRRFSLVNSTIGPTTFSRGPATAVFNLQESEQAVLLSESIPIELTQ